MSRDIDDLRRCPTCGSDEPKVRYHMHHIPTYEGTWYPPHDDGAELRSSSAEVCADPFHNNRDSGFTDFPPVIKSEAPFHDTPHPEVCPTCGWPTDRGIPETEECDGQAVCPSCERMRNVYFADEGTSGFVPFHDVTPDAHNLSASDGLHTRDDTPAAVEYDWREDLGLLNEFACRHPSTPERRKRLADHISSLTEEVERLRRELCYQADSQAQAEATAWAAGAEHARGDHRNASLEAVEEAK